MKKLTFALSLFALVFLTGNLQAQQDQSLIGGPAPSFELKNIDGNMVGLDDYKDEKGVILVFTCNHCPFSKLYEDRIIALDQKFKPEGYPVVAINPNDPVAYPSDDFDHMKERAAEKGFTFPYLVDETQEIATAYGATRTPHLYLLQKDGDGFKVTYVGAIDDNARNEDKVENTYLVNALSQVMKGEEPDPNYTKAVGCGIKWKN